MKKIGKKTPQAENLLDNTMSTSRDTMSKDMAQSYSDARLRKLRDDIIMKDNEDDGVGRIRTSGLQRPRLASYQARQRPLIEFRLVLVI